MPVQEPYAQFRLKVLDLPGQRRLLDAEPFRRTGHVPLVGDGDEVAQAAQVHMIPFPYGIGPIHILDMLTPEA